jgi:hypothetical protein
MNADPAGSTGERPVPRGRIWIIGLLAAEGTIGVLYVACLFLMKGGARVGALAMPSMFLAPAIGGFVASYIWRELKPTIGKSVLDSAWITFFAFIIAAILMHEGLICLVIVLPIFYGSVLAGTLVGRIVFKANRTRLYLSFLPLLLLVTPGEVLTRVDKEAVVTDEMIIRAPASKVWPEVTSFPHIPSTPRFWLFRIGLPYPVATTSEGDFVGAKRECTFNHGAVFRERVSEWEPQEKLTFEIVESPQDPELIGHLTPHRGQFTLRANPDGTTTLSGSTWYTLHVRPRWYFDLWTQHIFRAVHLRVMEDARRRAEAAAANQTAELQH